MCVRDRRYGSIETVNPERLPQPPASDSFPEPDGFVDDQHSAYRWDGYPPSGASRSATPVRPTGRVVRRRLPAPATPQSSVVSGPRLGAYAILAGGGAVLLGLLGGLTLAAVFFWAAGVLALVGASLALVGYRRYRNRP